MNTNLKGKLSELKVLTLATSLGISVSLPFGDKDKYDQIWDLKGNLIRVQIKTSRWKDERELGIIFNCYSISNGKRHIYTKEEIDYFATVWEDKCYLIPIEECSCEKVLWFTAPKNGSNYHMAEEYEIKKVLGI